MERNASYGESRFRGPTFLAGIEEEAMHSCAPEDLTAERASHPHAGVMDKGPENRRYVRRLLCEKQPVFAAALESVERGLSCPCCPAAVAVARCPP